MADQNEPAQADAAGEKKTRSPIERGIVWGGIIILLVVVGVEYRAKSNFEASLKGLSAAIKEANTSDTTVVEKNVKEIVKGYSGEPESSKLESNELSAKREDIYKFNSLFKTHTLYVYYGVEGVDGSPPEVIDANIKKVRLVDYMARSSLQPKSSDTEETPQADSESDQPSTEDEGSTEEPASTEGTE